MCTTFLREACLRETEKAPVKTGLAETDKRQPGKPSVREVGREGIEDTRKAKVACVDTADGGAESGAVGGRHG